MIDPFVWEQIAKVLSDPEIIARDVERRREDGSLDRDHAAVERMLATVAENQARIAKRVAAIDDDDVAAPLELNCRDWRRARRRRSENGTMCNGGFRMKKRMRRVYEV